MSGYTDIPIQVSNGSNIRMSVSFEPPSFEFVTSPLDVTISGNQIMDKYGIDYDNRIAPKVQKKQQFLNYDYSDYGVHCYIKNVGQVTIDSPDDIKINMIGQKYIIDRGAKRIYRIDPDEAFGIVYRNYTNFTGLSQIAMWDDQLYVKIDEGYFIFNSDLELVSLGEPFLDNTVITKSYSFGNVSITHGYDFNLVNYINDIENLSFEFLPNIYQLPVNRANLSDYRYGKFKFNINKITNLCIDITDIHGNTWRSPLITTTIGENIIQLSGDSNIFWESIVGISLILDEVDVSITNIKVDEIITYEIDSNGINFYTVENNHLLRSIYINNAISVTALGTNIMIACDNDTILVLDSNNVIVFVWSQFEHNLDDVFLPHSLAINYDTNEVYVVNRSGSIIHLTGEFLRIGEYQLGLNSPEYITIDSVGDLYISDTNNNRIVKMSPNGELISYIGIGVHLPTEGLLVNPKGIVCCQSELKNDSDEFICKDDLFVIDYGNYKINHYDIDGNYIDNYSFSEPDWLPTNLQEVDFEMTEYSPPGNDNFTMNYIIESYESRDIQLVNLAIHDEAPIKSGIKLFVTDQLASQIITLHPFLLDNDDNWYVSDVYKYEQMHTPNSIDYYDQNLYVCEGNSKNLISIINSIEYSDSIGRRGINDTTIDRRFNAPRGVTTTETHIYIADTANNKVQKIDKKTNQLVLQITGLNQPYDVAVDDLDNVFVANLGTNQVLRYNSSGGYVGVVATKTNPRSVYIARNNPSVIYIGHNTGVSRVGIKGVIPEVNYSSASPILGVTAWLSNASSYQPSIHLDNFTRKVDLTINTFTNPGHGNFTFEFNYDATGEEYIAAIAANGRIMVYGDYTAQYYYQAGNEQIFSNVGTTGIGIYPYPNEYFTVGMVVYIVNEKTIKKFAVDLSKSNSWAFINSVVTDSKMNNLMVDNDGYLYCAATESHEIKKFYGIEVFKQEPKTFNEAYYVGYLKNGEQSDMLDGYVSSSSVVRVVQPYQDSIPCTVFIDVEYDRGV